MAKSKKNDTVENIVEEPKVKKPRKPKVEKAPVEETTEVITDLNVEEKLPEPTIEVTEEPAIVEEPEIVVEEESVTEVPTIELNAEEVKVEPQVRPISIRSAFIRKVREAKAFELYYKGKLIFDSITDKRDVFAEPDNVRIQNLLYPYNGIELKVK